MTIKTLPATFADHTLDIIIIGNERWAMGRQVGHCIGFSHERNFKRLFQKHQTEFDTSDTMVVEIPDRLGRMQLTRLFSHKGVAKLAMLAQTPRAAHFRDWAAQQLTSPPVPPPAPALPADLRTGLARLWRAQPQAGKLLRYWQRGFTNVEAAKLLDLGVSTVRRRRREAEALGLVAPPAQLAVHQARALRLVGGTHHG